MHRLPSKYWSNIMQRKLYQKDVVVMTWIDAKCIS